MKFVYSFATALLLLPALAHAGSGNGYDASAMWGTTAGPSGAESSVAHVNNGVAAGQVNAAEAGMLISTGSVGNIYAIGSQTVVSNTITGNDNDVTIEAEQTSANSGNVNNEGNIIRNQNNN